MLKHVQISPIRSRAESLSIRSTTSCASSMCGSPEPPIESYIRTPSRASSYTSLSDNVSQTTIKIYTSCLHQDIEYKTLSISWDTSSRDVVSQVLRRCKMRHRDSRLFFLSMEVSVRRAGVRTILNLDDDARPALLQACQPKGDSRFYLQMKPGGLIRVHTSVLQPASQYKSLMISEVTSSDELLALLLSCFNLTEPVEQYSLYEVCPGQEYQRKLHPDDLPLRAQISRNQKGEECHFLVRKNPNYPRRRQILVSISEKRNTPKSQDSPELSIDSMKPIFNFDTIVTTTNSMRDCDRKASVTKWGNLNDNNNYCSSDFSSLNSITDSLDDEVCSQCKNSFKSCEFCNKNVITTLWSPNSTSSSPNNSATISPAQSISPVSNKTSIAAAPKPKLYNPVYNIREIRTVCNSFSSLGIDKKLFDIEKKANFNNCTLLRKNVHVREEIVTDPARGVGNFLYI